MPRANRPRAGRGGREPAPPLDLARALGGHRREAGPDGPWNVREVPASATGRAYRCPGCDQELTSAVAHLVVWPAEHLFGEQGALGDRRHWHRACWAARGRRRPT